MNKFESVALQSIKHYNMMSPNDKVLIALSGGKDSVALLLFLFHYKKALNISLYAAHVNHMIRGADADADMEFCRKLCAKYNIEYFCSAFDVPKIAAKSGMSVEDAARKIRYDYFTELSSIHGFDKIATAHTASDNTETVIYNLMRGSGTQGVCGIPPVRDTIVRPLIFCTKEQTEEYCNIKEEEFCTDFTNTLDVYDRNNIRLNIIPHMKKRNASVDASFSRLSYIARCDRMLISSIANDFIRKYGKKIPLDEAQILFSDEKMMSCAHEILCKLSGITLSFEIFSQCRNLISAKQIGKSVKLSDTMYLFINHSFVEISPPYCEIPYYETVIPLDTTITLNENVKITIFTDDNFINYKNINNLTIKATLNFDTINGVIFARKKKDGDAYTSGGITRSVKKHFSDTKTDRRHREYIPVICDESGIIWVPGMQPCDRVKPGRNNKTITIVVEFSK